MVHNFWKIWKFLMLDVAQVSNIPDYFVQSTLLLYGRRVDLDLEDAHREVCPPVCWVQVVLGVIRHVQVRPVSMNIFWNKGRSREKNLLFFWILSKLPYQEFVFVNLCCRIGVRKHTFNFHSRVSRSGKFYKFLMFDGAQLLKDLKVSNVGCCTSF